MHIKQFLRSGSPGTLFSAFLYFDISFMIWVMLGPLGNGIAQEFTLTATQKGFMAATPVLSGALLRLVLGPMADRIGARKTALIAVLLTFVPLVLGAYATNSFEMVIIIGILLGIAGASFAVALPMASRWYPPEQQGLVMGIAGAGNSGTVLAAIFAPRLAAYFGDWRPVFLTAMIPLAITWVVIAFMAKDAPGKATIKSMAEYVKVISQKDTWWFSVLYSVTFGGFVGLASFLPIFFHDQYGLDAVTAGSYTAFCVFAGSFIRPVGGWLGDRFGGIRVLIGLYGVIAVLALILGFLPPLFVETILLFLLMSLLGAGNGSVFQIVPQRFSKEIGIVTGIVGAAGGVGGFFLPSILGVLKDTTGSYGSGFLVFTVAALICVALLMIARGEWQKTWVGEGGLARSASPEPAAD